MDIDPSVGHAFLVVPHTSPLTAGGLSPNGSSFQLCPVSTTVVLCGPAAGNQDETHSEKNFQFSRWSGERKVRVDPAHFNLPEQTGGKAF